MRSYDLMSLRMFLGMSAYAEGELMEKVPGSQFCSKTTARKHESSFAIELQSHAYCPTTSHNWLQKRKRWACQTYAGWRGSRVSSSKQSPFQFEEECPQFHNCCLLTVQAMQLQSRLQSPKNCSWIKNRLAAVRQPLSRHWYDWEKLPASSVQYYVPLNLPRHGLTQQQSPAAGCDRERDRELQQPAPVQLTAGRAASRSRATA